MEIFRVGFRVVHPDICEKVTKSLLESLLLEALRTAQNKPLEVYRVPKLTDLFYAACGQLLAIAADECTNKQDSVVDLALLLVNAMRDAAPRNKSLFQWKLHENNPIASPRRRATGVMLAIVRMLLRRTLQRLSQGLSVQDDIASLVVLVRRWKFTKERNSGEVKTKEGEEKEENTGRGVRLLRWWLSLVLVSIHAKISKQGLPSERENVLERLRDLLQRTIPLAPSAGPVPLTLLSELLRRGDRDGTAMVAKKHLENEENVFRSIRKQFNDSEEIAIKKSAKKREVDIATRTEMLQVAITQRWDAVHMSSIMWIRHTANRCLDSLLQRLSQERGEIKLQGILTVQPTSGRMGVGMRRVVLPDPHGSDHKGLTHNNFKEKQDWTWENSCGEGDTVLNSTLSTNTELIGRGIRWSDEYWYEDTSSDSKNKKNQHRNKTSIEDTKKKKRSCSDIMSNLKELNIKQENSLRKGSGMFLGAFGALSRVFKDKKNEGGEKEKNIEKNQQKQIVLTVGKRHFSTKDPSLDGTKWKDFSTLERFLQRRDDETQSGETTTTTSSLKNRRRRGIEAELVVPMLVLEGEISFHATHFEYRPRRVVKDDRCDAVKMRPPSVMLCLRNGMRRWQYDQIRRVLSRRFMLQRTALEVFFLDGELCVCVCVFVCLSRFRERLFFVLLIRTTNNRYERVSELTR
jgi:hypothetical protein